MVYLSLFTCRISPLISGTLLTSVGMVTDMGYMFFIASDFNQDISTWDGKPNTDAACCFVLALLAAMAVSYRPT
jgi:hypothetical protein